MWFNNALVYRYQCDDSFDFSDAFEEDRLKPCPAHARFIYGWLPPFDQGLSHELAGCAVICLGKEERILPRSIIQRHVAERVKALETARGFSVKRAERSQLAEDIEFELLPKAFCLQKKLYALVDTVNHRIIINTSSANQAAQLLSLLRKSVPGLHLESFTSSEPLAMQFTHWINDPTTLPAHFELGTDCLLSSLDDEKKRFNCKGGELPEIQSLLSQGYNAMEVSVIWYERLQFTLTQSLIIKRLKCQDYLQDEIHAIADMDGEELQLDAKIMLLSGELRSLLDAIELQLLKTKPTLQTASDTVACQI